MSVPRPSRRSRATGASRAVARFFGRGERIQRAFDALINSRLFGREILYTAHLHTSIIRYSPKCGVIAAGAAIVRIPQIRSIDFQLASIRPPYPPEISPGEIPRDIHLCLSLSVCSTLSRRGSKIESDTAFSRWIIGEPRGKSAPEARSPANARARKTRFSRRGA